MAEDIVYKANPDALITMRAEDSSLFVSTTILSSEEATNVYAQRDGVLYRAWLEHVGFNPAKVFWKKAELPEDAEIRE